MRSKYIILGVALIICSSLFLVGCNREANKKMSYEIILFENAPKEVQNEISEVDKWIREMEAVIDNDHPNQTINFSGSVDLGKERYEYFITNNQIPKIIEVVPDKAYGIGIMIKHTTEYRENIGFPTTVAIVKLSDYYGKVSHVYVSHP
ncbi:hypothetical protein [Alkaliphilus sp. B6464]|uniref:hypothetical protein n=1 Tax=Alkaliphilus sp. B6464 TaxID=2731219 RepID=UPI001BA8A479|nr:hypothetical protein [Alkaliphilus sp. B6464]QUH19431.1 hypothetical protein HYG84_05725 [Alkaliphilus sp. B6464]